MKKKKPSAKLLVFENVGKNQQSMWSAFENGITQVIKFTEALSEWIKGDILEYVPDERIKSTCGLLDEYFTLLQSSLVKLTKVKTDAIYCVEYVNLFIDLCEKLRKEKHLDENEKEELQTCYQQLQIWFTNSIVIESLSKSWTDYRERVGKEKEEWTRIIKNLKYKKAWKYAKYVLFGFAGLAATACVVVTIVLLFTPAAPAVAAGALVGTAVETGIGLSTILGVVLVACGIGATVGLVGGYIASKKYEMVCEAEKTANEIKKLVEDLYGDSLKIDGFVNELCQEFEQQVTAAKYVNVQSGLNINVDPVQILALKNIRSNMHEFIQNCEKIQQTIQNAKQKYIEINTNNK